MTDHARAIEAGARANITDEMVERACEALIDCHENLPHHATYKDFVKWEREDTAQGEFAREWMAARRLEARASFAAAIASGALVPASAGLAAQLAAEREWCAEVADKAMIEFTSLLEYQVVGNSPNAAECATLCAKAAREIADKIRALDTAPASGDCTHANKFTRTKAGNDLTPENYCPDCDTVLPMLNAASSNGGGK